jgi:Spy/CpxP family protein refolding chaperone
MLKTIIALSCVALVSLFFMAGCKRVPPEERVERLIAKIGTELDLDAGQKEHLTRIKDELTDKAISLHDQHEETRQEVLDLLSQEAVDEQRLQQIYLEKRAQVDELAFLFISRLAEFQRSLTSEQRAKLVGALEKAHENQGGYCTWHR